MVSTSASDRSSLVRRNIHLHRLTIQGWDIGCLTMSKGEVARLVVRGDKVGKTAQSIPLDRAQAYGPSGFPAWGIGPNATLTFEIEILKIG